MGATGGCVASRSLGMPGETGEVGCRRVRAAASFASFATLAGTLHCQIGEKRSVRRAVHHHGVDSATVRLCGRSGCAPACACWRYARNDMSGSAHRGSRRCYRRVCVVSAVRCSGESGRPRTLESLNQPRFRLCGGVRGVPDCGASLRSSAPKQGRPRPCAKPRHLSSYDKF